MTELKPCPFCGSKVAERPGFNGSHDVRCSSIHCIAWSDRMRFASREDAIAAWNRRSPEGEAGARLIQSAQEAVSLAPIAAERDAYRALLERVLRHIPRLQADLAYGTFEQHEANRALASDIRKELEGGGDG